LTQSNNSQPKAQASRQKTNIMVSHLNFNGERGSVYARTEPQKVAVEIIKANTPVQPHKGAGRNIYKSKRKRKSK